MGRILFWILLGLAVYIAYRWWRMQALRTNARGKAARVEAMVRCEHCGLNLPESEAVKLGSRRFCTVEHRRLATGE
jgi:uncharacterized protein